MIATVVLIAIAFVWLANGLFCKVLSMAPRHQAIVAEILGSRYAFVFTKAIGLSEVLMAVWVLSRINPKFCAITQIVVVAAMNIIEFFVAPHLLLFGKFNSIFALMFILVVAYHAFFMQY